MKKIVLVLTMLMAFAFSSMAFAADGGDLNKEQRTAEKLMTSLAGDPATEYVGLVPSLTPELAKNMTQKNYTDIQKQVKSQLGTMKENKFYMFERFDQGDRVTYLAAFTKENVVIMSFMFAKDGKLQNFSFTPYKAPAAQQPAK